MEQTPDLFLIDEYLSRVNSRRTVMPMSRDLVRFIAVFRRFTLFIDGIIASPLIRPGVIDDGDGPDLPLRELKARLVELRVLVNSYNSELLVLLERSLALPAEETHKIPEYDDGVQEVAHAISLLLSALNKLDLEYDGVEAERIVAGLALISGVDCSAIPDGSVEQRSLKFPASPARNLNKSGDIP